MFKHYTLEQPCRIASWPACAFGASRLEWHLVKPRAYLKQVQTSNPFNAEYYERFYFNAETRAASPTEQKRLAAFIAAYVRYLELPIHNILDVGCGIGTILNALAKKLPKAQCTGVEFSKYLCDTYGWQQGSVINYQGRADLVVCADVLAYLSKADCKKALTNLATITNQVLYLSVLTTEDVAQCDIDLTDMQQKIRPAEWYKNQLSKNFVAIGGGLFLRKPLNTVLWQLEQQT